MRKLIKIVLFAALCLLVLFWPVLSIYLYAVYDWDIRLPEGAYNGWQPIWIKDVGTFMMPGDWVFTQKDAGIYITDGPFEEDSIIMAFGVISYREKTGNTRMFDVMRHKIKYIAADGIGANYSNHASFSQYLYEVNGIEQRVFSIIVPGERPVSTATFWFLDTSIDEETVTQVAKSFHMQYAGGKHIYSDISNAVQQPFLCAAQSKFKHTL